MHRDPRIRDRRDQRPRFSRGRTHGRLAWILLMALVSAAAVAQVPADAVFSDFKRNGEFLFELDGQALKHAEIYLSDRASSYLIIAPELASPLLINPRAGSVESVSFMKVAKQDDGTIDLLADASFNRLGAFRIAGQEIVFKVKDQDAKLKAKPPLLGEQGAEALKSYKPEYRQLAEEYTPEARYLDSLRSQASPVRVRVYFGTWCPVCGRLVPRILRLADELEGSRVHFEYYGLPQPMTDDPITKSEDLHGVPTAVVYVGDQEVGHLTGGDLNVPEKSITRLVLKATS